MVVRTAMSRGTTIPKGRVNMPREAKPKREDKILVFADGKLAQEAREAGADIVGGEELIEGVRCSVSISPLPPINPFLFRSSVANTKPPQCSARLLLSEQSHPDWAVSWVLKV